MKGSIPYHLPSGWVLIGVCSVGSGGVAGGLNEPLLVDWYFFLASAIQSLWIQQKSHSLMWRVFINVPNAPNIAIVNPLMPITSTIFSFVLYLYFFYSPPTHSYPLYPPQILCPPLSFWAF